MSSFTSLGKDSIFVISLEELLYKAVVPIEFRVDKLPLFRRGMMNVTFYNMPDDEVFNSLDHILDSLQMGYVQLNVKVLQLRHRFVKDDNFVKAMSHSFYDGRGVEFSIALKLKIANKLSRMSTGLQLGKGLEDSPYLSLLNTPLNIDDWHLPPVRTSAKLYKIAELQFATKCFSEENYLGEGSLGAVYRAEFPDGQIFAVKSLMGYCEEKQVLDTISNASRLRHPNIARLVGYCVESVPPILVYEYVSYLNLKDALHSDAYIPLTWGIRLQIAIGVAQALEYLESSIHL